MRHRNPTSARASFIVACLVIGCGSPQRHDDVAARPRSAKLAELSFSPEAGSPPVSSWIVRTPQADGSSLIEFHAAGAGKELRTLTVVPFGGDPHGVPDSEIGEITAHVVDLPDGQRAVRIDVRRVVAGSEHTETALIGLRGGEPHRLLEIRSGSARDRSPTCREITETSLRLSAPGRPVVLEAMTFARLEPTPGTTAVDATCTGQRPVKRSLFKLQDDRFVEVEELDDD